MLKTLSVDDIQPGHYITRVLEHKGGVVMRSKGKVKTQSAIEKIKQQGIVKVEIDLSRSDVEQKIPEANDESKADEQPAMAKNSEASGKALGKANDFYLEAVSLQGNFLKRLKSGAANDLSPLEGLSQNIINSVFEHPSAMCCLTMIKQADKYLLEHSINCSVLMTLFAEHLGYDGYMIEEIAYGALLMDLGMTWVSPELRNKNVTLNENDWKMIHNHVEHGLDLIERSGEMPTITLAIVEQHHERIDGSGYPKGLSGDDVSPFARMAAIVDTFDAIVSERTYHGPLPPAVALKRLTKLRGLDQELVRQFIACIGVYPTGSLVKLKSGKLALVIKTNPGNMLNPVVMTFYSVRNNHHSQVKRVDLSKSNDAIESSVHPSEFNLNLPKFFREVFVHQAS